MNIQHCFLWSLYFIMYILSKYACDTIFIISWSLQIKLAQLQSKIDCSYDTLPWKLMNMLNWSLNQLWYKLIIIY